MTQPRVSVVIPSYNRPEATKRAVMSALAQGPTVAEVVVVDDASSLPPDARGLQTLDPRVRVVRLSENHGAAGARQAGVDLATGNVLAFLDSDDVWHADKIAAQLPLLAPMTAVACGWDEALEDGGHRRRVPRGADDARPFFAGCWFCPGSTVLIRKEDFLHAGSLDAGLARLEDLDWFIRFGLAGGRLCVAPHIGATIAIGSRARVGPVEDAARIIAARYASRGDVTSSDMRTLRAWLRVERAKAAFNENARLSAFGHIVVSGLLRPRTRIQLEDWWPSGDQVRA